MITCREVSTLLANDQLEGQSWRRRAAVRLHLAMCGACRRFAAQVEAIRRGAGEAGRSYDEEAKGIEERAVRSMRKGNRN